MAVPKEIGEPIVLKANMAKRPSKMTATQVSKTAGMKILGRLAPSKRESTKPVAKPSNLPPIALGRIPVIFCKKAMAAARFQAANATKKIRPISNPPTAPKTNQRVMPILTPRTGY